nr:MAG TPA: hypothetical protein [Caudoviricetes sp.]
MTTRPRSSILRTGPISAISQHLLPLYRYKKTYL